MKVFITGGTGYIGTAVVRRLVSSGHQVTVLARNPEKAKRAEANGARVIIGDLRNCDSLASAIRENDALIHLALDFSADPADTDRRAVECFLGALGEHPSSSFIYTSGVWVLGDTGNSTVDETADVNPAPLVSWRPAIERIVLGAATGGRAAAVIRPGIVYGGHGGIIGGMFATAVNQGAIELIGTGENWWSLVHLEDLARLYQIVLEQGQSGLFHGVDNHPVRLKEIASAIAAAVNKEVRLVNKPLEQARRELGEFASCLAMSQRIVTKRSLEVGWQRQRRSFLEEAPIAYREWQQG